jgi:thiamine-phosphate pyrophosphorylase
MALQESIYRILDANFNRLREALRVIEEYFRFVTENGEICVSLKRARHMLVDMEKAVGQDALLSGRDTEGDCFASVSRPEEMNRLNAGDVLSANFKRAQEACRVIEEYSKLCDAPQVSQKAKEVRFLLYALQKTASG